MLLGRNDRAPVVLSRFSTCFPKINDIPWHCAQGGGKCLTFISSRKRRGGGRRRQRRRAAAAVGEEEEVDTDDLADPDYDDEFYC